MSTETPAIGDLELAEIMASVGADFGSTPVPPKVKEVKPVAVVAEIPDVEVPDLDAMEDSQPVKLEPTSVDDVELAELLASVPDTVGDELISDSQAVILTDKVEVDLEGNDAIESAREAIMTGSTGVVGSEKEPEIPDGESWLHKPEVKESLERAIEAVETKVTTEESEDEPLLSSPLLSSPYEDDDDDFKPIVKGGVTYYIDPARLKRDVAFSVANVDEAMMTHASMYVHYGVQQSKARGQYERTKAAFEILESRLDNEHRVTLKEENPKTTEAQIRAAVVSDERWKRGNARLIETRGIYDLASVALEAFSQRRDTLLQMAKTLREEQGGRMRLEEIREGTKASAAAVVERMKTKSAKASKELGAVAQD